MLFIRGIDFLLLSDFAAIGSVPAARSERDAPLEFFCLRQTDIGVFPVGRDFVLAVGFAAPSPELAFCGCNPEA